jgi:hypothetical protein
MYILPYLTYPTHTLCYIYNLKWIQVKYLNTLPTYTLFMAYVN